jgi:hypothetical protein
MNRTQFKEHKQAIRDYIRTKDDVVLARLTAMAQDGALEFLSQCKCIRGVCGDYEKENSPLAIRAELAMYKIGLQHPDPLSNGADWKRNRIIYAICRAEQKRREWAKNGETRVLANSCT